MLAFEPAIGVAEFARMIREAGGSISNSKLLGIARGGGFAGYRIYIYEGQAGSIEGWISREEAERWIRAHSVERQLREDILGYAQRREESA